MTRAILRRELPAMFCVLLLLAQSCASCGDGPDGKNNGENDGVSCGEVDCDPNASCDDSDGDATCTCKPGFSGDGVSCDELVASCEQDGDCGRGVCDGGRCTCDEGYASDGTSCVDADECATSTHDCGDRATCSNTDGGFVCTCGAGWTGDGSTCVDLDECAEGVADCSAPNTECSNTEGSYECVCGPGYTGDGTRCSILADCEADPSICDENATCTDTPDGTACICDEGFRGDGATCRESGFVHITAAGDGTCGMRRDGTVACWGWSVPVMTASGLIVDRIVATPEDELTGGTWTHFTGGTASWCGVQEDGTLWCSSLAGFEQVSSDTDWKSVSPQNGFVFEPHVCAIKTGGTLWCWGENGNGQLGNGTTSSADMPLQVGGDADWAAVAAGEEYTCAIKNGGSLWCWGRNDRGFLGSDVADTTVPTRIGSDSDWASLHLSRDVACALKTNGESWCWGGHGADSAPSRRGTSTWKDYTVDGLTGRWCGIKMDGTLWCFGANLWGERGHDTNDYETAETEPTQVGDDSDWEQVAAAAVHTCARKANNDTYCFGHNVLGQLGIGEHGFKLTPTRVQPGTSWRSVALGQAHTCAITTSGQMYCAGSNIAGHLGIEELLLHVQDFTRVGTASNWNTVSAGIQHTCGTRDDGTLWCAGYNGGGQLGLGENVFPMSPGHHRVGEASDWASVDLAPTWSCGITQSGELRCFGTNDGGQLGTGGVDWAYTPTPVGTSTWKQLATGGSQIQKGHTCAIAMDDTLWCWGFNHLGQLGLGTMSAEPTDLTPRQVGTARWRMVDVGADYTCGIQDDNSLWCWGGAGGRLGLGQGNIDPATTPQRVGTTADWKQVSTGLNTTCGIKMNDTLWCWGDATSDGLGVGPPSPQTTQLWEPTRVGTDNDWAFIETDHRATCGIKTDGSLYCWGLNRDGQLGTGDAWTHIPQPVSD